MYRTVYGTSLDSIMIQWAGMLTDCRIVNGTKEELFARSVLEDPCNVWMANPERKHNVIIQLAETLWVLSGRNDMEYLTRFLPKATTWSDDGEVWRAGYGPRLREYTGIHLGGLKEHIPMAVDQIQMTVEKLKSEPKTRQAYISIWDPVKDHTSCGSKDYPCNVGIHYIVRDKRLYCSVNNRSNDLIWGYSGINAVEFTILQRLMANWVGLETIGDYIQCSNSLHVYESMYDRLDRIAVARSETFVNHHAMAISSHSNLPLLAPEVSESLEIISYFADLEMLYRTDPLTARGELLDHGLDCYDKWPEFTLMFILPMFYNRPELRDTLKMFNLQCLHPLLQYNITECNALKHEVQQ